MSTAEILVRGRNRKLLFDKLSRGGVSVKKIKTIDDKNLLLTVDAKDCDKVFAICGETWYNKLIRVNGLKGLRLFIARRAALVIGVFAFFIACVFSNRFIMSTEIRGASPESALVIESVLADCGVKRGFVFSREAAAKIEREVLKSVEGCSFVTAQKRGNRLIIEIFEEQPDPYIAGEREIYAREDGVITKLIVYRGEALFALGDSVKSGDLLLRGVGSGAAMGVIEVSSSFVYEYTAKSLDEGSEARAIAAARSACPRGEDCALGGVSVEKIGNGAVITVELTYILKYGG